MQNAKPAERIINADGTVTKAAAPLPWTSQEVTTPYTNAPTRTHGKVCFALGRRGLRLLGHRAVEHNKSVVLTAGHCVNEGPGDFATNWEFVPAYKDGSAPSGVYVASEPVHEFGLGEQRRLQLRRRRGGSLPVGRDGAHGSCRRPWHLVQLQPLAELRLLRLSGRAAVHRRAPVDCNSPLQTSDNAASPATMGIGCDMTGGSSGGGWIVGGNLYSVNSYGYDDQPDVMFGPYLDGVAQSVYNAAAAD